MGQTTDSKDRMLIEWGSIAINGPDGRKGPSTVAATSHKSRGESRPRVGTSGLWKMRPHFGFPFQKGHCLPDGRKGSKGRLPCIHLITNDVGLARCGAGSAASSQGTRRRIQSGVQIARLLSRAEKKRAERETETGGKERDLN